MLLQALVLGKLLIVFIPDCLKLLLLVAVLIYLLLELVLEPLDGRLELFNLGLLEVKRLELVLLRLQLANLLWTHSIDSLVKFLELRFVEVDLLAAVPLLLGELDSLSRSLTTCTLGSHGTSETTERTLLHQRRTNSSCHRHLLGHGRLRLKLLMDGFDDLSKR